MKRYLSLWFPDWPLTRLRRANRASKTGATRGPFAASDKPHQPFILIETGAHGLRVAVANASARELGIDAGLGFADAKARAPHLAYEDIDRVADEAALRALANWMIRFSPLVSVDDVDGLMLETTGCDHLYGGEAKLLQNVSMVLTREGFPHRSALASTPVAASALARAAVTGTILEDGDERVGLADLPVSTLRLTGEAETLLRRFGLARIGQLYGIDRKALARRFQRQREADDVLLRLDQALGLRYDPIRPLRPVPARTARLPCPEPLACGEAIRVGLGRLATTLCADLEAFGQGARGFALHAFRTDGTVVRVEITAAKPVRSPKHILRLFEERIDKLDPGFGIDLLLLEARRTDAMDTSAVALSADLAANDTDTVALAALADRICAKLGEGRVTISTSIESHLPEQAERQEAFAGDLPRLQAQAPPVRGPRPIRLLRIPERVQALAEVPDGPPLRFTWRRVTRTVVRADGPERISPEWWTYTAPLVAEAQRGLEAMVAGDAVRTRPRARDYYRVEDKTGRRYWLFREGLYDDGRGGAPEWFMHGLFA